MWSASRWSWCIFQLPLTSGRRSPDFLALAIDVAGRLRPRRRPSARSVRRRYARRVRYARRRVRRRPQRGQRGQVAALDEFERRAAAGREEVDPVGQAEVLERAGAVATADDGEPGAVGDGLGDPAGPAGEPVVLDDAERPVPQHRAGAGDGVGERRRRSPGRCRARASRRVGRCRRPWCRPAAPARRTAPRTSHPAPGRRRRSAAGRRFPESSSRRQSSTRSRSTIDPPTSRPSATRNVNAMAPPTARTSTLPASDLSTPSLSATFAPPTTATNGRAGSSSRPPSTSTSSARRRPAALGRRVGGPTTDACRRWATPNASLTYASNPSTSDGRRTPGRWPSRRARTGGSPSARHPGRGRPAGRAPGPSSTPRPTRRAGCPRWLHAVTAAPSASSHSSVGSAARIRKSSTTVRSPWPSSTERDVEIGADEDPAAPDWPEILEQGEPLQRPRPRRLRHERPPAARHDRRSRPGRPAGSSSPTRCRTSRAP